MYKIRRRPPLSQNFLHDRQLVKRLVRQASIASQDTVIEIGPGKGIITGELLAVARQVVAVEIDPELAKLLVAKFENHHNFVLFQEDILNFPYPMTKYKVVSNLPFAIEGEIVHELLDLSNPPEDMHVVVIKDVAERWVGAMKEGQFSLLHKPWFELKITHHFSLRDFVPIPKIRSVMFQAKKRAVPLVSDERKKKYAAFIKAGFGGGRRIDQNLVKYFDRAELKKLAKMYNFSFNAQPSNLSFPQWLKLFDEVNRF